GEIEIWCKREVLNPHVSAKHGCLSRSGQGKAGSEKGANPFGVSQADIVAFQSQVELNSWPKRHTAPRGDGPAAHLSFKTAYIHPGGRNLYYPVAVVHADWHVRRMQRCVHNADLPGHAGIRTHAMGVDIKADLPATLHVSYQELGDTKIDGPLQHHRGRIR